MASLIQTALSSRWAGTLCLWTVLFTAFYYPIGAGFVLLGKLPSTPTNIAIRSVCTVSALYLIALWLLNHRHRLQLQVAVWFVLGFWVMYTLRIFHDLAVGITFASYSTATVVGITFGNILLPVVAVFLWARHIPFQKVPIVLVWLFALANITVTTSLIIQNGGLDLGLFLYRPHLKSLSDQQTGSAAILNPIQIGYYGELLALAAIYFLSFRKDSRKLLFTALLLLGLFNLVLGASRGPFLNFLISGFVMLSYRFIRSRSKVVFFAKVVAIALVVGSTAVYLVGNNFKAEDFSMFNRVNKFLNERKESKKEYRDYQFLSAWNDFLDSPVIGKQFVGTYDNFYPHNIIVEIFMATGILGALLFYSFFIPLLLKLRRIYLRHSGPAVFLLVIFTATFMGTMFSGALFQSVDLWILIALLLCIPLLPAPVTASRSTPALGT